MGTNGGCGRVGGPLEMADFAKKPILRVKAAKRNIFTQWEILIVKQHVPLFFL